MVSDDTNLSSHGSENGAHNGRKSSAKKSSRRARKRGPLDQVALRDLALSYAAKYATTGAKLESYLARKVRERGIESDDDGRDAQLDIPGIVTRMIELGYIDDAAYAQMRSRDLTARGYGKRRVEQALWAAGVENEIRESHAPTEATSRRAAVLLAKKRGFGVFGRSVLTTDNQEDHDPSRKRREKQVAAMLRAGHTYDHVRYILDAESETELDDWQADAEEDEHDDF